MNATNFLRYLVPTEWSAEQALLAADFLGQVREAIWTVHVEVMTEAILADPARRHWWSDFVELEDPMGDPHDCPDE